MSGLITSTIMFQVPRFNGAMNGVTPKSGAGGNNSALVLESFLKKAESRQELLDNSRGTTSKRTFDSTSSNNSSKRKKVSATPAREETTAERDVRKASAKEEKRLRKQLERSSSSDTKISGDLDAETTSPEGPLKNSITDEQIDDVKTFKKPAKHVTPSKKVNKGDFVERLVTDENHAKSVETIVITDTDADPIDNPSTSEPAMLPIKSTTEPETETVSTTPSFTRAAKNIAEQLQPSGDVRDESQKVLSLRRTDDDEDFTEDYEGVDTSSDHPNPMSVPESIIDWELNSLLADNLIEDGVESFFPVQRIVIPQLLRNNSRLCVQPRDMCVSAPTGSGKTIAYAVPILQSLMNRSSVRLRALLLLPSRELATQVYRVFCRLSRGTNLAIAVCTGQTPLADEQKLIMGSRFNALKSGRHGAHSCIDPDALFSNRNLYLNGSSSLGQSAVDILICTPGRLLDHIQYTEGFTLQHLRFLVLDEADRLLGNAYHSWVRTLVQSSRSTEATHVTPSSSAARQHHKKEECNIVNDEVDRIFRDDILKPECSISLPFLAIPHQPLQRLLFSATLTDNPRKLAMLGIKNPLILRASSSDIAVLALGNPARTSGTVGDVKSDVTGPVIHAPGGYMLPQSLKETIMTCETSRKPLVLLSMLLEAVGIPLHYANANANKPTIVMDNSAADISDICRERGSMILVFSSSVETTHRLCRLLQSFNTLEDGEPSSNSKDVFGGRVAEMSRLMRSEEREAVMREAAMGEIKILVSSDHMARGIDLPNIKLVVNYDPPKYAKMYVHRVGRTARANREGHSLTLLKAGQTGAFKKMRGTIGSSAASTGLMTHCSNPDLEKRINRKYLSALERLTDVIDREGRGDLALGEII